jgi:hypothetical protein
MKLRLTSPRSILQHTTGELAQLDDIASLGRHEAYRHGGHFLRHDGLFQLPLSERYVEVVFDDFFGFRGR